MSNKKIMLVDDDPVVNMIHSTLIARTKKFQVDVHTNGQQALNQLTTQVNSDPVQLPGIIFLDINMPLMDGWQFLVEFEKLLPRISQKVKVFIVSSSVDVEDIRKSKTFSSVLDFISKPLTAERIKDLTAGA